MTSCWPADHEDDFSSSHQRRGRTCNCRETCPNLGQDEPIGRPGDHPSPLSGLSSRSPNSTDCSRVLPVATWHLWTQRQHQSRQCNWPVLGTLQNLPLRRRGIGPLPRKMVFGQADWMRRNLENRVEVVAPIRDKSCINRMREIMEVGFSDARNAHLILPDGNSEPISSIPTPIVKEAVNKGTFGTLCDRGSTSSGWQHAT